MGDAVFLGSSCGEPQTLVEALLDDAERWSDLRIVTGVQGSAAPYAEARFDKTLTLNALMATRTVGHSIAAGRADYLPVMFSQVPDLIRRRSVPVDVAFIQVSPPRGGHHSLGVSVGYVKSAIAAARVVIAEVNERMPWTYGDSLVSADQLDLLVESDRPLLEVPAPPAQDVLARVGHNVASLVRDGSTVQVGVGSVAEAVWKALGDKRGLGVHSGSLPDAVVDLIENGVVTNEHKPGGGKTIAGQLIGTERLYSYANRNPRIELHPAERTHSPLALAELNNFVSVNSALQVDVRGQVNSETLAGVQVSGIGGALDFAMGARLAAGGRSIVALPSTAGHGRFSRIVPRLEDGVVTVPGSLVDFVVTEHGVADLRGKALRERAEALLEIADPSMRAALDDELRNPEQRA